jgi:prevent-host-death family protein
MRTVSSRDLRDNLASWLDAAQAGERILVTRRGEAVAEIVRAASTMSSTEVAEALRQGIARRAGDIEGLRKLLNERPRGEAADLVAQVLADRR